MECDPVGCCVRIGEDVASRDTEDRDSSHSQPSIATFIAGDDLAVVAAIDFDAQARRRAVEVEDVRAGRVLLAEAQAALLAAQGGP